MTTEAIVLHQKWPSLPLRRFPRECWRPSALQASTLTHRRPPPPPPDSRGAFTCLPLNSMPTRQEWMKRVWEHGKLDNPVSGKFVRTKRLSVTSVISHGNSVLFAGVLICYCFITPSGGGRASGSLRQQKTLLSEVDIEITVTLLRFGLKICFFTKHFKITRRKAPGASIWII